MAGIYKYITGSLPEITMCDKNVIAYNVEIFAENSTEIMQFDAHELWRKNQEIYNGDTLSTGTDSTELICKVTDKQGNVYIIPASRYEELKEPTINGNGTKNYYWRLYFDNLTFTAGSTEKYIGWRDFIRNYIIEDNIFSIVLNGIANNQIQFSVSLSYESNPTYSIGYNGATQIQATKILGTEYAECDFTFTYTLPNNTLYNQIGNASQILNNFGYTKQATPGLYIENYTLISDVNNNGVHTLTLHTIFTDAPYFYTNVNAFRVILCLLNEKTNGNLWWQLTNQETIGATILAPVVSTPIITLPTTTQYNKGNITLQTNIAIVTSNETEQNKIEYNTADITYTLTNINDATDVIQGQGVWSSKSEITDSEQGAMYDNVINVSFSDIAIGSYIYKVVYTYSDGNIYTEEIEINVIALTLSYFGITFSQYGNVLNKPVSLYFSVTTGSCQGTKPAYIKMVCTCIETSLFFEKYIYLNAYGSAVIIDFRPLLPKYYNANNQEYNIKIDSILYNSDFESYETTTDNRTLSIIDATDKIAFPMFLYESNCSQITSAILPQFLYPLQGYNTKLWITFFQINNRLFLNNDLIYTAPSLSWDKAWDTVLINFTNITESDMLVMRGLWSVNDTIKPLISVNAEHVMVKFVAPDGVEMPEFAMILESIYTDQQLIDTYFQNSRTYPILFNMYNCVEKVKLSIPMLTAKSIYYYNDLFANQNIIKVSNGNEWQEYQLTKIDVQEATENYNNGKFTIELENILTTKKYIQI